jgi:hypothetical protein
MRADPEPHDAIALEVNGIGISSAFRGRAKLASPARIRLNGANAHAEQARRAP